MTVSVSIELLYMNMVRSVMGNMVNVISFSAAGRLWCGNAIAACVVVQDLV